MKRYLFIILAIFLCFPGFASGQNPVLDHIEAGMSVKAFQDFYPKKKARTYRSTEDEQWITYNYRDYEGTLGTITFYFSGNKLVDWAINDREEVIQEYLSEYCSQSFIHYSPKIYTAIKNALKGLPQEVFLTVTDRARPILFTEYHYTGIGRFANSSEIISFEDDAPSMMNGLTIIKLSTELELAQDPEAIEGVVAHEIAHRYLEHAKQQRDVCDMEKEANRIIKKWGFARQFAKAKKQFGNREGEGNCK